MSQAGLSDSETEADKSSRVRGGKYSSLRSDLSGALVAFDRAQDWADLIHDLQRVNRVLLKHESSSFIPDKVLLAKRLSQCLTPSLPSGVHLKALETYHIVFGRIGPKRLAKDLLIYSAGPFPLYAHAATSLKGSLLSLYETHYIPLGRSLRPVADGFVLALLPGLDDETSEFYERTLTLMSSLEESIDSTKLFHAALWRALLRSPSARLSAANYLKRKMAKLSGRTYASVIEDTKLVAMAVAAGLRDQEVLVQRSSLELLVGSFSLDSDFFGLDKDNVIGAAMETLLRRELSLTKRVHAWLVGGHNGSEGTAFCSKNSKSGLLVEIKDSITKANTVSGSEPLRIARPYKIAGALLDKQEIAASLAREVALMTFESAVKFTHEETRRELDHAVGQLVSQIGHEYIFDLLETRLRAGPGVLTEMDYRIVSKALKYLPMQDNGVRSSRLPQMVSLVVASRSSDTDFGGLFESTELLLILFGGLGSLALDENTNGTIQQSLKKFAEQFESHLSVYDQRKLGHDERQSAHSYIASACLLLSGVSHRAGQDAAIASLNASLVCISFEDDPALRLSGTRAFVEIAPHVSPELEGVFLRDKVVTAVGGGWSLLSPSSPTSTAFAAELWISLQKKFPKVTEEVISAGILSPEPAVRQHNLETFARLWTLVEEHHLGLYPADSGVYLMLDALSDEQWATRTVVVGWLQGSLQSNPGKVLDIPMRLLLTPETATSRANYCLESVYDVPRALYAFENDFQLLRAIRREMTSRDGRLQHLGGRFEESHPSSDVLAAVAKLYGNEDPDGAISLAGLSPAPNYTTVIALACLGIIRAVFVSETEQTLTRGLWMEVGLGERAFSELHSVVKCAAAEFLCLWVESLTPGRQSSLHVANKIASPALRLLSRSIESKDLVLQLRLLNLVEAILRLDGAGFPIDSTIRNYDPQAISDYRCTAIELSNDFLPTIVQGLQSASKPSSSFDAEFFAKESMGLRKKWIAFCSSCISLVGVTLPMMMEKVLSILCQGVLETNGKQRAKVSLGDSRLDLLEGIAQISLYVTNCYSTAFPRAGLPREIPISFAGDNQTTSDENQNGSVAPRGAELMNTGASALSSLNPLRLLNEFVKDVFVGAGAGNAGRTEDPRKAAARILFRMLPLIVAAAVSVWVPWTHRSGLHTQQHGRSPHKKTIMSLLEMWLHNHPIDVLAAFVVLWNKKRRSLETTKFATQTADFDVTRGTIVEVLVNLSMASPGGVTHGLCKLLEKCLAWDENSPTAAAGRLRHNRLSETLSHEHRGEATFAEATSLEPEGSAHALFSPGDFFAENSVMEIELSSLSLLNAFFLSSEVETGELSTIWTAVSGPVRDILASTTRPLSQMLLLPVMSSFCSLNESQLPDKRQRKEFLAYGGQVITACSAISAGTLGQNSPFLGSELAQARSVSNEVSDAKPSSIEERQNFLAVRALSCMPVCVHALLDRGSAEDRASALGYYTVAVGASLNFLKLRQSGKKISISSWRTRADEVGELAAAAVLLEAAECHWALKIVKKEFIGLLEDPNFFLNKNPKLLNLLSRICNSVFGSEKSQMVNIGSVTGAPGVVGGGLTAVFAGREVEIAFRARSIRRISFCLFSGEQHSYRSHISPVLEKLRDSLRMGAPTLTEEAFLCLRVLLLRSGPASIVPFRATILAELTRVLTEPLLDLSESIAALRFIDLLMLLSPPEFAYERCFFFAESIRENKAGNEDGTALVALVTGIAAGWDEGESGMTFRQNPTLPVAGGRLTLPLTECTAISYAGLLNARVLEGSVAEPNVATIEEEIWEEFTSPGQEL